MNSTASPSGRRSQLRPCGISVTPNFCAAASVASRSSHITPRCARRPSGPAKSGEAMNCMPPSVQYCSGSSRRALHLAHRHAAHVVEELDVPVDVLHPHRHMFEIRLHHCSPFSMPLMQATKRAVDRRRDAQALAFGHHRAVDEIDLGDRALLEALQHRGLEVGAAGPRRPCARRRSVPRSTASRPWRAPPPSLRPLRPPRRLRVRAPRRAGRRAAA